LGTLDWHFAGAPCQPVTLNVRKGEKEMSDLLVSIYCPFCHKHTALQIASARWEHPICGKGTTTCAWIKSQNEIWWIGICNSCHNPVLVKNRGEVIYPSPLPTPSDERIPEHIRKDLDEAKICFSVKAYRACAVMARRAIQAAAIDKGAQKEKLVEQINELEEKEIITKELKEWATVVRWVGNDAAHPGNEEVSKEDAEDILKLAEQFLNVIYVTPAIALEMKRKRGK